MKREQDFLKPLAKMGSNTQRQMCRIPLIEICGQNRVLIENHRGILSYDSQMIGIKVKCGSVRISGEALTLAAISREKVIITGKIFNISLPSGG